jgi:hypothetical protein
MSVNSMGQASTPINTTGPPTVSAARAADLDDLVIGAPSSRGGAGGFDAETIAHPSDG